VSRLGVALAITIALGFGVQAAPSLGRMEGAPSLVEKAHEAHVKCELGWTHPLDRNRRERWSYHYNQGGYGPMRPCNPGDDRRRLRGQYDDDDYDDQGRGEYRERRCRINQYGERVCRY
jgi:hypothetical protein